MQVLPLPLDSISTRYETYPTTQPGEQALIVQGTEGMQLLHGRDESLHGRGVHEVEAEEVVDAHGLQGQHGGGQVSSLDLWYCRG